MNLVNLTSIKVFSFSLMLLSLGTSLYAQSTQRGLVQEYHGSDPKTPLKNVSVAASNAGAAISDDKGEFTLSFRTLHPGDAIQFRRVELAGYEVMNQEALENARIANPNANPNPNANSSLTVNRSPLTIVMARRETLQKLRDGYRSVAVQRYEKQLKASEAEIERLKQEGKLAEEQYNERMNALEEAYEEKLNKLENYIDKFARIDLSDLDNDEQQIISLVQDGKFDDALDLYDKQNLADRLRQSREDQKKLTAMRDQLDEAAKKKALENQRLRQSIDRQITLLYMAGGEENLLKIHELRHQVFLADTTHLDSRIEYATSLYVHSMTKEAIALMKAGLNCHKEAKAQAHIWIALSTYQYQVGERQESLVSVRKADSLLLSLQSVDNAAYSQLMPVVYTEYLVVEDLIEPKELKMIVDRCLDQWNPDTLSVVSVDKYSYLLSKLSNYFNVNGNHEKSIWAAREGLKIGEVMQRRWPWLSIYWRNCAIASTTFAYEGMRDEAVQSASKYIELLKTDLKTRSNTSYVIQYAYNSYLTLDALVMLEEYPLADSLIAMMNEWKVMEKLEKKYPKTQDEVIGLYEIPASSVLLSHGKITEAEALAMKALDRLATTEAGEYYMPYLRPATMARIRQAQGKLKEAESLYQEAIEKSKANYEADPNDFDADTVCRYYISLVNVYQQQGDIKSARKTLKLAKKYATFEYDRQLINNIKI